MIQLGFSTSFFILRGKPPELLELRQFSLPEQCLFQHKFQLFEAGLVLTVLCRINDLRRFTTRCKLRHIRTPVSQEKSLFKLPNLLAIRP